MNIMKKLLLILAGTLLTANTQAQNSGYTIWFDQPNTLENRAIWLKAATTPTKNGKAPRFHWETAAWGPTSWAPSVPNESH